MASVASRREGERERKRETKNATHILNTRDTHEVRRLGTSEQTTGSKFSLQVRSACP